MSLRLKVLLAMCAIVLLYGSLDYWIHRSIVFPSFIALERKEAVKNVKRCKEALRREVYHLDAFTRDRAAGDDTYRFVVDRNEDYVKANFVPGTLTDNKLNLVYICNANGEVVWGKVLDPTTNESVSLAEFPGSLRRAHPLLQHTTAESSISGVFMTERGPLLVASRPILTSERKGPIRGSFIMGRFLTEDLIKTLVDQTRVEFAVRPIATASLTADQERVLDLVTSDNGPSFVFDEDDRLLAAYSTIGDIHGFPALLMRADVPRDISAEGAKTIWHALFSIVAVGISLLAAALFVLNRNVIGPIARFTSHVTAISQTNDLSARLGLERSDEIGVLAREFDNMMEELSARTSQLADKTRDLEQEVQERRRMDKALRLSEERFREMADLLPDIICETDLDLQISYMNNIGFETFGYSPGEVGAGLSAMQLIHPDDRKMAAEFLGRIQEERRHGQGQYRMLKRGGEQIDVIVHSAPRLKDGEVVGFRHSITDITERKRFEAQLQRAKKMETIGTLAGGLAHDFNNLLDVIQGNASLLLHDIDSTHPHYDALKSIEQQAKSGAKLTAQLLGYARKGKYETKPIDLNQLVSATCEAFGRTRKETAIHFELVENLDAIEADEGRMEQVLLNVLVNAADAMEGGGDLYIKTRNVTHDAMKDKVLGVKPGNYVLLEVTDTGTGMDEETVERIFEPFFTTKEIGPGTGLGLASVYEIVESHGGCIDVDSKLGVGTTVKIYLPATEKAARGLAAELEPVIEGTV